MDAVAVEQILIRDVSGIAPFDNAHGITLDNLDQHLVIPPIVRRFENAGVPGGDPFVDAWIVLDECPASDDAGYVVVFYPPQLMYGLAIKSTPTPVFLGCYGSLADTLTSM